MVRLSSVAQRFEIPMTVIEGGSGVFRGVVVETSQNTQTATVFTDPRRLLRVRLPTAVKPGMVIRSSLGEIFIVANNGGSEFPEEPLWQSFKLFKATDKVSWKRRGTRTDPVTRLQIEDDLINLGDVWVAIEPLAREAIERRLHVNIEQAQFIAGAAVQTDDVLQGRPVMRSDEQLGVRVGVLS